VTGGIKTKKGSAITANNRDCNYIVIFFSFKFFFAFAVSRIWKNKGISLPHVVHNGWFSVQSCLISKPKLKILLLLLLKLMKCPISVGKGS
jgi:hypothetical protein